MAPLIFIVDGDRGLARQIVKALQREGFATASASAGAEAIDWLKEHTVDLMLLDLELPDMRGRELILHLTHSGRLVPFIIITGLGDERVAVEMMKGGALDYLVKDIDLPQFVPEVVRRALAQLSREKKLLEAKEALRRSEANLARAQELAHLGSYEIQIPFSKEDYRSDEIFRIIGVEPRQKQLPTEEYLRRFVHPADREHFRKVIEKTVEAAAPFDFEYRVVRPDGAVRYVQSIGEPVIDQSGRVSKLIGTLLDITERKQMENAVLEISEREQRRIGQDLHDGLGQHLAGMELMSQVLEQNLAAKGMKAEANKAGELAKHVRDAISQARSLARGLAPVVLESEGLMSALQELAENTERVFGATCRFRCQKPVPIYNPDVATHLYRIAQEAVFNAIKHGKPKQVVMELQTLGRRIRLEIKDDGLGVPKVIPKQKGMGLRIMQYRASMIGGSVTVEPQSGGGTIVVCSFERSK